MSASKISRARSLHTFLMKSDCFIQDCVDIGSHMQYKPVKQLLYMALLKLHLELFLHKETQISKTQH